MDNFTVIDEVGERQDEPNTQQSGKGHNSDIDSQPTPSEFDDLIVVDEDNSPIHASADIEHSQPNPDEYDDYEVIDEDDFHFHIRQRSMEDLMQDVDITTHGPKDDLVAYLRNMKNRLQEEIKKILKKMRGIKFWIAVQVTYINPKKEENKELKVWLNTGSINLINEFQMEEVMQTVHERILLRNAHFIREKSGLILNKIHSTRWKISKFLPLGGKKHQELPQFLKNKYAIINVKNQDDKCFAYALLSALHPAANHANDPKKYQRYFEQYRLDQIEYPVRVEQIPELEEQIQINLCIYSYFDDEGKGRYPIYVSKKQHEKTIDLLYFDEHYAWIKNFSAFMNDKNSDSHKRLWCKRCLGHFWSEHSFQTHQMYCKRSDFCDQIYTMPAEGSKVRFKHYRYNMSLIIYVQV